MWKFSIICSFMAIFTGIALNLISNSIQDKRKQLSKLEEKIEKLKILETEWEFHTQPKKLMQIAENKLGMSSKEIEQLSNIKTVEIRSSAWKMNLGISKQRLLKNFDQTKIGN